MATSHVVVERASLAQGNTDEATFGCIGRLADRLGNFARLAVAKADAALLVAYHHQSGKAETTATLHHLRHAVDMNEFVGEFAVALFAVATLAWFTCHVCVPILFGAAVSCDVRS